MIETYFQNLEKLALKARTKVEEIVFYDIGARDGLRESWDFLAKKNLVRAYGFDPAEEHVNSLSNRDNHVRYLPFALGDQNQTRDLIKTFMPGCSSFLEPNFELLKDYPSRKIFEVIGKEEGVQIHTIDYVVSKGLAPKPHFIKIDTQGFELQILKGAESVLSDVLGIELETQFKSMYKEQALFPEVKDYLESKGFILRQLEVNGPYEGEFLEADAYFSRRPALNDHLFMIRLWQEACQLRSPKFLAQMENWLPEWKAYLTDDQLELNKKLFGPLDN